MKIFRIMSLVLAMGLFALNFWALNLDVPFSRANLWAYFRISIALCLVLILVFMVRRDIKREKLDEW